MEKQNKLLNTNDPVSFIPQTEHTLTEECVMTKWECFCIFSHWTKFPIYCMLNVLFLYILCWNL